jgi:hypothetical protein
LAKPGTIRTAAKPAKKIKTSVRVYSGMTTALRRKVSALLAVKVAANACGYM